MECQTNKIDHFRHFLIFVFNRERDECKRLHVTNSKESVAHCYRQHQMMWLSQCEISKNTQCVFDVIAGSIQTNKKERLLRYMSPFSDSLNLLLLERTNVGALKDHHVVLKL